MPDMAFSLFLPGSPTIALSVREGGCADAASGSKPVKRQAMRTPDRHGKGTPHRHWDRLVPVANRGRRRVDPQANAHTENYCFDAGVIVPNKPLVSSLGPAVK